MVPGSALTSPIRIESPSGTASTVGDFIVAPRITEIRPARGAPGTLVTVEGANFDDVSNVYFGLEEIPFKVTSSNQLAARIPSDAINDAPLVVVSVAGFGLSPKSFVRTGPGPIIDSFEPTAGAPGTVVRLNGINLAAVTQVRFGTTVAPFTITGEGQIQTVVPTNSFSTFIVVTGGGSTVQSLAVFTVTRSPVIANFNPMIGKSGTQVLIEGINFSEIIY